MRVDCGFSLLVAGVIGVFGLAHFYLLLFMHVICLLTGLPEIRSSTVIDQIRVISLWRDFRLLSEIAMQTGPARTRRSQLQEAGEANAERVAA